MTTYALIISGLIPNVSEFEALALSDGQNDLPSLMDKRNKFVSHSINEIQLSREDVEDLLSLINKQNEEGN